MNPFDRRTVKVLFTIFTFVALMALAYEIRRPIITFVFAVFFAYLLDPIVTRLQTLLGGSRSLGIAATYVLMGIGIAFFLVTTRPRMFKQGQRLEEQLPQLLENVGSGRIAQEIGDRRGWDAATEYRVQDFLSSHRNTITHYSNALGDRITELAENLLWVLLVPVLAVFFLEGKAHFGELLIGMISGERERHFFHSVLVDLDVMLSAFIRSQLSLTALSMIAYTIFLLIARFPYALAVGAVAGLLEFIPLFGALITAALILGLAVLTGYPHWIVLVVFLIIWRIFQDYVSSPYLMGRGLQLHPLAIIFGVLCGGQIGGLFGIFLSIPIMAAFRIIWTNWRLAGEKKLMISVPEAA